MAEQRVRRRLAAILAADVVGYSRLIRADEEGTLARVQTLRNDVIDPSIARYDGRIVKLMGDGMLAEFPSAVDAVRNAVEVQNAVAEFQTDVPEDRRIIFRVGVNLGDVVIDGDDIQGDGVNVAARLEALSDPGGICISGKVYEEVRDRIAEPFEDEGEQTVKNIDRPVRVWRWSRHPIETTERPTKASEPLPLTDKPSIAVLPFDNMSGDPEQEYFADGMAEDIITALSRFRWFFVVARNSSFAYKGRNQDIRQIGQELGVRYILEGSVRKSGERLRINAQLIEAATANHLWADKYDGAIEDVFDLQDQITAGVAGAIEPSIRMAEIERARRKRPDNLDAYDLYLRALPHAWVWAPAEADKALALLEKALLIQPEYPAAHGLAAWCNSIFPTLDPEDARRHESVRHARAVLDPHTDDSLALAFAAFSIAFFERDYDAALDASNRSLALSPNYAMVLTLVALVHAFAGQFNMAIRHAKAALQLSPFDPMRFTAEIAAAYSHFFNERYDEAAEAAQRSVHINPQFVPGLVIVAASRACGGHTQLARQAVARLIAVKPNFRISDYIKVGRFPTHLNEIYAAAIRKAGLPE